MSAMLKTSPELLRRLRIAGMVVCTVACAALLPLGAVGAMFSPLVFDQGANLLNPLAWLGFILMIGFWIVLILGPFVAWVFWTRNRHDMAWAALAAPFVWAFLLAGVLQFIPA
jgi:hypothetical protein